LEGGGRGIFYDIRLAFGEAETRTGYLPYTCLECYRYTKVLRNFVIGATVCEVYLCAACIQQVTVLSASLN
jgi:hypothetical protein